MPSSVIHREYGNDRLAYIRVTTESPLTHGGAFSLSQAAQFTKNAVAGLWLIFSHKLNTMRREARCKIAPEETNLPNNRPCLLEVQIRKCRTFLKH